MFTTPALDPLPHISRGHFDRWRSRVRGLPEFAGELPTCVLAEEIATPGPGQVRGLLTVAGNPVLSSPNGSKLQEALAGLDFMASVDLFVNETTRFAHIILPPTGALEHEHYDIAFHLLAVRNTAKFSPALFPPASDARHDWQILRGLAGRLSPRSASPLALAKRLASRLATPERIVDLGLRFGTHRLSLAKLRRAPHGIDLGPLEPRLPKRLYTPARRIELAPAPFVKDLERLRRRLSPDSTTAAAEKFDLLLIGRRQVRSNNSWMGHIPRLTKGKTTCTALIHTSDAASRGIKSGDLVRVSSRVGTVVLPAVVIEGIMPGVVSIPHGFGHGRAGVRLDFDERALGVSANDLTDESVVDALVGTAVLNGVPVRLEPA
jgi:anaerobic selenocysteine-containing dehydrogenase